MKKIAVYLDRWLSGGIESYLVSNFEAMDLSDMEITIITTRKLSKLYDERLHKLGIDLVELLTNGTDSEMTRVFRSLMPLKKHLLEEKYDVLYLNIYNGVSLIYSKIAKDCGIEKIIAHSHNSAVGEVRLKKIKVLSHNLCKTSFEKNVSDFWACSDLAANWMFTKNTSNAVKILNNGVNTAKFTFDPIKRSNFREKYSIPADMLVLGTVGRLNNQKNQMFLLSVANELKKRAVPFILLIAGDGELRKDLMERIIEDDLSQNVRLLGVVNDVSSFYSGIDIFLLPSLFEGNPLVGIEAQCTGATCLFSNTITSQAVILKETKRLSLLWTTEWVNEILNSTIDTENRTSKCSLVKDNYFDINDTSQKLKILLSHL